MGMEVIEAPTEERLSIQEIAERIKELKKTDSAQRTWFVALAVVGNNDLVYERSTDTLYYQPDGKLYYSALDKYDEQQLVIRHMELLGQVFLPKQIDDTVKVIKLKANTVEKVDARCIMISEHLFWDTENGQVSPVPTAPVFRRLFDTPIATEKVVKIPPFTSAQEDTFMGMYEQVKGEIERGEEPERFEPLKVWANGSHDIYMDLHRAHAYCFLKKKPLGVYLLTGLRRNGKSTYIYMTHAIMGSSNTSRLKLTELGNVRKNLCLTRTLMNGADEEDDKLITEQGVFKTLADHGLLDLEVMYAQQPRQLECDFMCFFPANHTPEWEGAGAGACMNRSLIIPFTADLSQIDNKSENYAQETFTGDFMAEYLGSVFAYAYYYHRHAFDFSTTMRAEQSVLEADLDSSITYINLFKKYFHGFESYNLLYRDYFAWCRGEDVKPQKMRELKNTARKLLVGLERQSIRKEGLTAKAYVARRNLEKQRVLTDLTFFSELQMRTDAIHGHPNEGQTAEKSVITELERYYMEKRQWA